LIKVLAGVIAADTGSVTYRGVPIDKQLYEIGYVAQASVVIDRLTAREALTFTARLRLPPDTSLPEIRGMVDRLLGRLGLGGRADILIKDLSGGQLRRVDVAAELLGEPGVLGLDEPTTGLDPHTATDLMNLLQALATPERSIVVVTHRPQDLAVCSRVVVVGDGGVVAFDGRPVDALAHFGVTTFDEVYRHLGSPPAVPAVAPTPRPGRRPPRAATPPRPSVTHQTLVLAHRSARVLARDRRSVAIVVAQAPLLGLGAAVLAGTDAFSHARGRANAAAQLLFILCLVAIWLGAFAGQRVLIADRATFLRERAVGVRVHAYLASRFAVYGVVVTVQALLLCLATLMVTPLHARASTYAVLVALLVAAALAGLMVSGFARTADQATTYFPLAILPQMLFAGEVFALRDMGPLEPLAIFAVSRWALAGAGSSLSLDHGVWASPGFHHHYGQFFDLHPGSAFASLALLSSLMAGAAFARMRRLRA
jgi:ABC-type lipoprotein export system ATPase subunit